ncbi:uncharacterized protein F4812DRAFT_151108 [Daldinia caldariorum]|uniref:uncharacterized protein n=1 Tax=Daldinia caldariorum TaxID=326644 RepID=UPI0020080465|nr:uncharacterized protein F4812DRAFT_151108 [Daldinia caldariorum]KAI1464694.1 hypothetical protein F4812DRAFT_151108 [Daldinia caldariorum]
MSASYPSHAIPWVEFRLAAGGWARTVCTYMYVCMTFVCLCVSMCMCVYNIIPISWNSIVQYGMAWQMSTKEVRHGVGLRDRSLLNPVVTGGYCRSSKKNRIMIGHLDERLSRIHGPGLRSMNGHTTLIDGYPGCEESLASNIVGCASAPTKSSGLLRWTT